MESHIGQERGQRMGLGKWGQVLFFAKAVEKKAAGLFFRCSGHEYRLTSLLQKK
jgi:hypothetical protein